MGSIRKRPAPPASRQAAARRAVRSALDRHRLVFVHKRFSRNGMTARVLIDGEYYDVDERRLAMLEAGKTPADLLLEPESGDDE